MGERKRGIGSYLHEPDITAEYLKALGNENVLRLLGHYGNRS